MGPWSALCALIAPFYPKPGNGRPPVGIERMLRLYFLQQWLNLSDPVLLFCVAFTHTKFRRIKFRVVLSDGEIKPTYTSACVSISSCASIVNELIDEIHEPHCGEHLQQRCCSLGISAPPAFAMSMFLGTDAPLRIYVATKASVKESASRSPQHHGRLAARRDAVPIMPTSSRSPADLPER